jgi:LEA14-like dessication related protein
MDLVLMSSVRNTPGLLRLIVIGWLAMANCVACVMFASDLQYPSIRLAGVRVHSYSLDGMQVICELRVENTNDVALPLKGAQVSLQLADAQMAQGQLIDNVTIPAFGVRDVNVLVDVNLVSALAVMSNSLSTDGLSLPYEIDGYVDVGVASLGRIRFHETGSLSLTAAGLNIRTSVR